MANEIPGKKRIVDHEFLLQLFFDYVATKRTDYQDEDRKLYVGKIYGKIARIKSLLEMLQVIRIMVAETHPSVTDRSNSKIKVAVSLRYHIENYFLRITTYRDLIFQLILTINKWDSNSKPNNLKGQLIKLAKNEPGILGIIDKVEVLFGHVKTIRNILAHEGLLTDLDVALLEVADFLNEVSPESIEDEEFILYLGAIISKNTHEMMQIEEDLATNLLIVCDVMCPLYKLNM